VTDPDGCDPRIARTRAVVLESTLDLLVERGYDGLAIEAVAEHAGVAKTTIYRHWPTKELLVSQAVACLKDPPEVPDSGDLRDDLRTLMRGLAAGLRRGRWSKVLPIVVDAAERHPELRRLHREFVRERQNPSRTVLSRAIERGELPRDADVELGVAMLAGPLFYRRLINQASLGPAFVDQVVDGTLAALGARHPERSTS
jgi:AcrR family transcriptional regulator